MLPVADGGYRDIKNGGVALHVRPEHGGTRIWRMPDITDYKLFLRKVARALGRDVTPSYSKLGTLWTHASDRQLLGWEQCRVDVSELVSAYSDYKIRSEWHSDYLDWLFLDAMLYSVIYALIDNVHDDVLQPGDTGNWLPHIQRAFANSSEKEKEYVLWLEVRLTLTLTLFRWLPTVLLLALGIACFYVGRLPYWFHHGRDPSNIGEGWPTLGWTILGLLAAWRSYRSVRWLARFGLRRRAWRMVNMLTDAYALLGARLVPTRVLQQAVEKAQDVCGRSAVFGGNFWAVLDDVCARRTAILVPGSANEYAAAPP